MLPGLDLVLDADALSVMFVALSTVLWLVTTLYAIGYLEHSPHRSRFFGFFSLCVSATVGVALAGNLVTFLIFYELLTLATFPLVVHRGTPDSMRGGQGLPRVHGRPAAPCSSSASPGSARSRARSSSRRAGRSARWRTRIAPSSS